MLPDPATDLVRLGEAGTMQLVLDLERAGALTSVSLDLNDPEMTYESWESLGRFFGTFDRAVRWWVGDWLNFGERIFGEAIASQGVESTTRERYDRAERVTGLDHGTLMNISSICGRVAKARRDPDLGFWIHAEVAPLEPAEQERWLTESRQNGWTRATLRDKIREAKRAAAGRPASDDGTADSTGGATDRLSPQERLEAAARIVFQQGQPTSDGSVLVPPSAWAQLRSALGEE